MNRRIHLVLDAAAVAFFCGAIFFLSSLPRLRLPVHPFKGLDKLSHAVLYCGLGLLVCRFAWRHMNRSAPAAMLIGALFATLYGLSDEMHQSAVPGRRASAADFAMDGAGGVGAALAWRLLARPRRSGALMLLARAPEDGKALDVSEAPGSPVSEHALEAAGGAGADRRGGG